MDTSPTRKIDLFHFFPVKAQTIPTNLLLTSTTFYQKLFSLLPTSSTISSTHFSHTNNQNSNKQSTFPKTPYQISFPAKNATPRGGGGHLDILVIRSLSKLKNNPKALISGQKSTLILIKR